MWDGAYKISLEVMAVGFISCYQRSPLPHVWTENCKQNVLSVLLNKIFPSQRVGAKERVRHNLTTFVHVPLVGCIVAVRVLVTLPGRGDAAARRTAELVRATRVVTWQRNNNNGLLSAVKTTTSSFSTITITFYYGILAEPSLIYIYIYIHTHTHTHTHTMSLVVIY